LGLAAAGVSASGCLGDDDYATGKVSSAGSKPEHASWLYDPEDTKEGSRGEWYGYILVNPSEIPESHRLHEVNERFGIETNLKFYRAEYDRMGMMGETDRTSLDLVKYSEDIEIMDASPDERLEDTDVKRLFRAERPASTGGFLEEQEVVETVGGFDIYERGAAVNEEENILVCGIQEYVRQDVVPAVVEAYAGESEPYATKNLVELWDSLEVSHYNEFGLNPGYIPSNDETHSDAFGTSQTILDEDTVEMEHVEIYGDGEPPDEFSAEREGFEKDGEVIKYAGTGTDIATSYDHRHASQASEPL